MSPLPRPRSQRSNVGRDTQLSEAFDLPCSPAPRIAGPTSRIGTVSSARALARRRAGDSATLSGAQVALS